MALQTRRSGRHDLSAILVLEPRQQTAERTCAQNTVSLQQAFTWLGLIHPSLNLKQLNEKKSLRKMPASDKALSSDKPSYSMRYAQTKAGLRETPCTQCTRSVLLAFFAWQITGWKLKSSSFRGKSITSGRKPPAFNVLLMYWVAPRSVRNLCLKCVSGTAVTSLEAKLQTKTSSSFGLLLPGHARAAANTSSEASG